MSTMNPNGDWEGKSFTAPGSKLHDNGWHSGESRNASVSKRNESHDGERSRVTLGKPVAVRGHKR